MQRAILVKNGLDVCMKCAYGGDISDDTMNAEVARLEAKYPSYTIVLFNSDQDVEFVNAVVNTPIIDI